MHKKHPRGLRISTAVNVMGPRSTCHQHSHKRTRCASLETSLSLKLSSLKRTRNPWRVIKSTYRSRKNQEGSGTLCCHQEAWMLSRMVLSGQMGQLKELSLTKVWFKHQKGKRNSVKSHENMMILKSSKQHDLLKKGAHYFLWENLLETLQTDESKYVLVKFEICWILLG